MTILVTGATGRVGHQVVHQFTNRGADVRALVRNPSKVDFPASVNVVQGDMLDIESLRRVFVGVRILFLLSAVAGDEFTQALPAPNVARESGIKRVICLSIIHAEHFVNVPHFTVKSGAGRMIKQMGFNATILHPAYFMDNEHMAKDVIVNRDVYPMPTGNKGVTMVDTRDIAEATAIGLIHQDAAPGRLPIEAINLVDPDTLTSPGLASIRSETLGRPVAYGDDGPSRFETNLTNFLPRWMVYEMRLMIEHYVSDGMVPQADDVERLTHILRRSLDTYRDFAATLTQ